MREYAVKVHGKGLMVIPAPLREKYDIKKGSEVVLVDEEGYVMMIPKHSLVELYGVAKGYGNMIDEMVRELHEERRREARS